MYTPSTMSILGMDMCAIQKFLFHFIFISNLQVLLVLGVSAGVLARLHRQVNFKGPDKLATKVGDFLPDLSLH
jgi:hypothetical protein